MSEMTKKSKKKHSKKKNETIVTMNETETVYKSSDLADTLNNIQDSSRIDSNKFNDTANSSSFIYNTTHSIEKSDHLLHQKPDIIFQNCQMYNETNEHLLKDNFRKAEETTYDHLEKNFETICDHSREHLETIYDLSGECTNETFASHTADIDSDVNNSFRISKPLAFSSPLKQSSKTHCINDLDLLMDVRSNHSSDYNKEDEMCAVALLKLYKPELAPSLNDNLREDCMNSSLHRDIDNDDFLEDKLEKMYYLVNDMESEVSRLNKIGEIKELNNKSLQESLNESTVSLNDILEWNRDFHKLYFSNIEKCNSDLQNDIEKCNSDLQSYIKKCKGDLQNDIEKCNSDLQNDIKNVQTDLKLTAKYENLETKLSEDNIVRELTEEMGLVRKELIDLNRRITDIEKHKVSEHNELNEKIREIQEKKDKLSQVTQTFIISRSDSLTDEQNTLYKQCVMAQNKLEEKHDFLLKISDTWQQLESDLMKFQSDLRSEVEKLTKELGKPGDLIQELMLQKFSSIQDPAVFQDEFCKVFSERDTNLSNQSFQMYQATTMPSCEGSDSGISDSEHDCERDRKLTDLRRQQKDLESILTASRKTLLAEKIDETEQQLRNLRNLQKARRLLFHSTLLPAAGAMTSNGNDIAPWNVIRNRKNRNQSLESTSMPSHSTKDDESDPEPHKSNSRLWRIVRAALPFHLAIIVFVCIAWLLDPRCCDQINNLNLSSSPQLKYFSGPPPT